MGSRADSACGCQASAISVALCPNLQASVIESHCENFRPACSTNKAWVLLKDSSAAINGMSFTISFLNRPSGARLQLPLSVLGYLPSVRVHDATYLAPCLPIIHFLAVGTRTQFR